MFRILRTLGVPALVALAVSAACSSDPPSGDSGAGEGGSPSANGGKGGSSTTHAGSAGKSGSSGRAGNAAVVGGAGGDAGTGGQSGEGGAPMCPDCASGFCLADGTCVDCLPSNDHCADGKFCTDANECVPGCKANGGGCASGACDAEHSCQSCISDAECLAPLLCNDGTCSAACTALEEGASTGCDGGLICCSLHCAELATDSQNCGSCGHACDSGQFCGAVDCGAGGAGGAGPNACVACHETTLANVCSISKIIVILDTTKNSSDGNRVPGRRVGQALHDQCSPTPVLIEAEQDSVDALDALNLTTGRPVSGGGELLVVAGGPYFQNLEGYVEDQHVAPLYSKNGNGVTEFRKTSDDSLVVQRAIAGDHDTQDDFIIQFSRDPASGSLVLNLQGFWLSGTVAAAYQVTNAFLPQLATLDNAWYAYTWKDKNGDLAPDADEMTLVDSGN
jgi:hypothetical protein